MSFSCFDHVRVEEPASGTLTLNCLVVSYPSGRKPFVEKLFRRWTEMSCLFDLYPCSRICSLWVKVSWTAQSHLLNSLKVFVENETSSESIILSRIGIKMVWANACGRLHSVNVTLGTGDAREPMGMWYQGSPHHDQSNTTRAALM